MNTREAADRWATTWAEAWNNRDVDAIVEMQATDGVHWESMFRPAFVGRNGLRGYLESSFSDETAATTAWFCRPIVDGDRASVEYWARATFDSQEVTISGTTVLRFNANGLVVEARDYSNVEPGHHPIAASLKESS